MIQKTIAIQLLLYINLKSNQININSSAIDKMSSNSNTATMIRTFLEKAYSDADWTAALGCDYSKYKMQIDSILLNQKLARGIWADILRTNTTNKWATANDLDSAMLRGNAYHPLGLENLSFCSALWRNLYH